MGVSTNLGTKVNRRKRAIRTDPNVVKNVGPKGSDKGDRVVIEIGDAREETEEIPFNKFLGENPKLLTMVVNDLILVRVSVNGKGTGGGMEEIRKEISDRYLCKKRYFRCGLMRFGGGGWDGGNRRCNDGQW